MNQHHFFKFLGIVLHYGWLGILYGIVGSLLLEEKGLMTPWIKILTIVVAFSITLWLAYRVEMRYHMPTKKYIVLVCIAFLGALGSLYFPLTSPLFFGLFLASITYKCADCVAFTRKIR